MPFSVYLKQYLCESGLNGIWGFIFLIHALWHYPLAIVILFIMAAFVPEGWRLWVVEDCFVQALIPKPIECENTTYVIRKWEDVNYTDNNERFYLYRKASLVEHLISIRHAADIEYEKGYARRILEVDENKGILKVEVDVYTDYDFARTEIQEWEINKEETK